MEIECIYVSSWLSSNLYKTVMFQHAARYLVNQDWVKNDSLKAVENTAVMSFFYELLLLDI